MQQFCIDHATVKECKILIQKIIADQNYIKEVGKS